MITFFLVFYLTFGFGLSFSAPNKFRETTGIIGVPLVIFFWLPMAIYTYLGNGFGFWEIFKGDDNDS